MIYLHLDLRKKRQVQKAFIEYTQSNLSHDKKIEEFLDWENKKEILQWLDSLWRKKRALSPFREPAAWDKSLCCDY